MGALGLRRVIYALAALESPRAFAHDVDEAQPIAAQLDLHWSYEPWVIACLALSMAAYAIGLTLLWKQAGRGRGIATRQALSFLGGWLLLVVALVSPLDGLGSQLFSAHMLQHELLMVVVAPLLVLGRPLAAWAWALPHGWRRRVGGAFHHPAWRSPWKWITAPLGAWLIHACALWLWHVPAWFEAALADKAVHTAQHVAFLFSALLFWWAALGASTRPAQGIALLYFFTTMLHTGALGALLTLSPVAWYPSYFATTTALGWSGLEDQQLGGLVMWVPAGLAYLAAGLALTARLLRWPRSTRGGATAL